MSERKTIFEGRIVRLIVEDGRWEIALHADAVAILALRGQQVLGVRQFRPAVRAETWELPAGLIDPGETPEAAAMRELAEEAQLSGSLTLLSRFFSSPGFTDEQIYLFGASALSPVHADPDPDEHLTLEWRDLEETWSAIREGSLHSSAPTVLGLAVARDLRAKAGR